MKHSKKLLVSLLAIIALTGCSGIDNSKTSGGSNGSNGGNTQNNSGTNSGTNSGSGTNTGSTASEITPSDTKTYTALEGYTYTAISDYDSVLTDEIRTVMADDALPSDATALADASIEITQAGNYVLTGDSYTDVTVNLSVAGAVHIYLNGATITAKKKAIQTDGTAPTTLTITAVAGTINTITSKKNSIDVGPDVLVVNGSGTLNITSTEKSAIKASGFVYVANATLNLEAQADLDGHGISAETVLAKSATINVNDAGKDGIHAELADLVTETGEFYLDEDDGYINSRGFVYLKDVTFKYVGTGDGIQADTYLYIDGGNYDVTTTATWVAYSTTLISSGDYESDDFKYKQSGSSYVKVDSEQRGRSGTYALQESVKGFKVGTIDQEYTDASDNTTEIDISSEKYYARLVDATVTMNTPDDGIHVNEGALSIEDGKFEMASLDQPLCSDGPLYMNNIDLDITSSYEGVQGSSVTITGANTDIDIVATDDGMNATSDYLANDAKFYQEVLTIANGTVDVVAGGDGLDSNGSLIFAGGTVHIEGSSNGGDSPLDSATSQENSRDNGIYMNGGTVVATGMSGMLESPQTTSYQYSIIYAQNSSWSAGAVISLKDSNGNTIVSQTATKAGNAAIFSSPSITKGSTYYVYVNSTSGGSATVSSINTTIGTYTSGNTGGPQGGGGNNPGGNHGGGPGGR